MDVGACFRAPTKVILLGEHFVVRGAPALAAAVNLYTYACWRRRSDENVWLYSRNLGVRCTIYPRNTCGPELEGYARIAHELNPRGLDIYVYTEAPIGAGLGSSASSATVVAAALLDAAGTYSREEVARLAFEAEKVYHGRPSGIDNAIALEGGFLLYHGRMIYETLKPRSRFEAVIGDTGVPRSTRKAVSMVLKKYTRHREAMNPLYLAAARLVWRGVRAVLEADARTLGELLDISHGLLYALGVSSPEIERLVWAARRAGALGAKLTGAGLGGVVIALAEPGTPPIIARAMLEAGAKKVYIVELGAPGLTRVDPETGFRLVLEGGNGG